MTSLWCKIKSRYNLVYNTPRSCLEHFLSSALAVEICPKGSASQWPDTSLVSSDINKKNKQSSALFIMLIYSLMRAERIWLALD